MKKYFTSNIFFQNHLASFFFADFFDTAEPSLWTAGLMQIIINKKSEKNNVFIIAYIKYIVYINII